MIHYFTESEDYRKRVAAHDLLAAKNHVLFVTVFKNGATTLLDRIKDRLEKTE